MPIKIFIETSNTLTTGVTFYVYNMKFSWCTRVISCCLFVLGSLPSFRSSPLSTTSSWLPGGSLGGCGLYGGRGPSWGADTAGDDGGLGGEVNTHHRGESLLQNNINYMHMYLYHRKTIHTNRGESPRKIVLSACIHDNSRDFGSCGLK